MSSGTSVKFDASHHAVVNLLGLGTMLVLPITRVRLLRLQKQDATTVFQAVMVISPFETKSLQQRQLPKNYIQLWDS